MELGLILTLPSQQLSELGLSLLAQVPSVCEGQGWLGWVLRGGALGPPDPCSLVEADDPQVHWVRTHVFICHFFQASLLYTQTEPKWEPGGGEGVPWLKTPPTKACKVRKPGGWGLSTDTGSRPDHCPLQLPLGCETWDPSLDTQPQFPHL